MDAACSDPLPTVSEPFNISTKAELFLNLAGDALEGLAPVVADLDGDGISEVVVVDYAINDGLGRLGVFDSSGTLRWEVSTSQEVGTLLLADVDGNAGAEVVAGVCDPYDAANWWVTCPGARVAALRADGTELWRVTDAVDDWAGQGGVVADLRGDGHPAILQATGIFDAGSGSCEAPLVDAEQSTRGSVAVADADGDGVMEIAAQGVLWDAAGARVWAIGGDWVDSSAMGLQLDGDAYPEFLFFRQGWTAVDGDGAELFSVHRGELNTDEEPPVVADFDGDGTPEVAVSYNDATGLVLYRLDGTEIWRDTGGYYTAIGAWDFDADGAADLVGVRVGTDDTSVLRILDGQTGSVQFETALDATARWSPFAADIDADGHAELLVPGGAPREGVLPSVTILHQSNDTWAAAGPSWPTRDFQLSSIGPAGEVPRGETAPPSWAYNEFHARPAVDPAGIDLSIQDSSVCWDPCTGTVTITARVGNTGPGASVETGLEARAGNSVLAIVPVVPLQSGAVSDELELTIPGTAFDGGEVVLSVDPEAVVVECDEGDNEVVLADPR